MGNIGKPDAKARGGKGRLDWEHSVGTPPASWERPRADSVRIVEHVPVCQLAVESFENPVSKVRREAISKPNTEVRYAKFEGQAIIHETSALHAALIPTGIQVTRARIRGRGSALRSLQQIDGIPLQTGSLARAAPRRRLALSGILAFGSALLLWPFYWTWRPCERL